MTEKKDSNPKDALGIKKVPFHVIPSKPLLEVGLAMMEGGRKYGSHNYREIGVSMSTYYNAAMRHLVAWWEGEDIDPDSGVHHVVKAMASLFVVRDGMHMGNCVDDRPIRYPDGINIGEFNKLADDIITKYPECAKPFLHHEDDYNAAEIDGPLKFEPGDVVFINLRKDGAYVELEEAVKENNSVGEVVEEVNDVLSFHLYVVEIGTREYKLYPDEMTLLKKKGD